VAVLTAPSRERAWPFMNPNRPPTYTLVPSTDTAMPRTAAVAVGAQLLSAPVLVPNAASLGRFRPSTVVNSLPT